MSSQPQEVFIQGCRKVGKKYRVVSEAIILVPRGILDHPFMALISVMVCLGYCMTLAMMIFFLLFWNFLVYYEEPLFYSLK